MEDQKLVEAFKSIYDSLTDEQKEKAAACADANELSSCLGEMGVALPDELLDEVAGGVKYYTEEEAAELRAYTHMYWEYMHCRCEVYRSGTTPKDGSCPHCGSGNVSYPFFCGQHVCMTCDWTWVVRG